MIVGGLKCFILSDGDVREENAPLPQHKVHGQILECVNHFTILDMMVTSEVAYINKMDMQSFANSICYELLVHRWCCLRSPSYVG